MTRLSELVAPSFYGVFYDVTDGAHTHYWLRGGRGSTKSSFVSIDVILEMMRDPAANAVVIRKVAANLKDSVYEQLLWAIDKLGVSALWTSKLSPLEIVYNPTGQRILFRGADKPRKLKSTKVSKGYIRFIWYEECDEFSGMAEIRTINQSMMRGVRDMIIDEKLIEGGLNVATLAALIRQHEHENARFGKLRNYYMGLHAILGREKADGAANNRVVCNHAKYIVDMAQAYIIGIPVKYAASEDYDIAEIDNAYLEQDMASTDSELTKMLGIFGRAYELVYSDAESKPRSAALMPEQAFVAYSEDCEHKPLFGAYFYKSLDLYGRVTGVTCTVYDSERKTVYAADTDAWESMTFIYQEPHWFGGVPLIEHINNAERIGDFEQQISLIDAYNTLQSDRVNDKEQFVNSFLFVTNMDLDSATAKKLKEERILLGYEGGDAKFLADVMTESDIKVLRDDYKEDIHRFSMVPDLSDESFGNNLSGVAIKYKLLGFEQMTKNKERYLSKSLRARFSLYNNHFNVLHNMPIIPTHRVDVIFTHNLPANNLEIAQMLGQLDNMLTLETKLSQLDFVTDAEEEAGLVREEKARQKAEDAIYTRPIQVNTGEDGEE